MAKSGIKDVASSTDSVPSVAARSKKNILHSKTFKDGAIYLFHRGDYQKPIWFCRVRVPNVKGYIYRSTRTPDEHLAFKFADNLYNQTLVKVLGGVDFNSKRIGEALDAYQTRMEPQRARQSVHYKLLLIKRVAPFLAKKTFADLDTALISKLITELSTGSRQGHLSGNTIRRIYSDLKHFLNWCVEEGYTAKLPKFPRIPAENARRPHFDGNDWRRLTRHLREFVKIENKAVLRDRIMLVNYVLILANTGIRVGEARALRWRDVRPVDAGNGRSANVILTVKGKTGIREVVSRTPEIKGYLKAIHDLRVAELSAEDAPSPDLDPGSLVFCHKDGSAIGSFKKSFQALLRNAKAEKDTFGQTRTLYSLRHTYATFRLHEGVNHYALAQNMGTSVAMLERFYGHTSNVAAADELTKMKLRSRKTAKKQKGEKASAFNWLAQ